jgi:hypothetical protein
VNHIGGYFELELRKGEDYHKQALRLNTGRNAFAFILIMRKYKLVFIPYYTCDVLLESFLKYNVRYEYYSINNDLEPIFNFSLIKEDEGFLYTNYFGLKDIYINKLSDYCRNLIVDNSQAFFSHPIKDVDTFYSARKFFGVPDGAYLYMKGADSSNLSVDVSLDRFGHLLKRIEFGAESGYNDYKINDLNLIGQPIKQMSKLTQAILCNIDYEYIKKKRRENFLILSHHLEKINKLEIELSDQSIPMVYPFLIDCPEIKNKLIENKIFVATYWHDVLKYVQENSLEYRFVKGIVPLPVDQRIEHEDISLILRIIEKFL